MGARDVAGMDAPPPPLEPLGPESDYALVIGIDHYSYLKPLQGASNDALKFAAWLKSESGGRVPEANIKTLLSDSESVGPRLQDDVDEVLWSLLEAVLKAGKGRRIYLFFSGHGATTESAHNLALCLARWSTTFACRAMSSRGYLDFLVESGHFDEIVAFLDCCRMYHRAIGASPTFILDPSRRGRRNARTFIAYATENRNAAFEAQVGDSVHGVFTSCLLEGLKYAEDEGGPVTSKSLKGYLEVRVYNEAQRLGLYQRAEVVDGMATDAPAIFCGSPERSLLRIEFVTAEGEVSLTGGAGQLVQRGGVALGDVWELYLRHGLYKIREAATGRFLLIDHKGEKGGTHVKF